MCTAVSYRSNASYFGRNLDLDRGYGERVVITPRNYEIQMRCEKPIRSHDAMIGMACVVDDFPLYYEATNEHGVSMAGLNFPENAVYGSFVEGKDNVTPFELIPWVLARSKVNWSGMQPSHTTITEQSVSVATAQMLTLVITVNHTQLLGALPIT